MAQEVELPDDLVADARRAGKESGRSAAEQTEYWARLGLAAEAVLEPATVQKLLRKFGLPQGAGRRLSIRSSGRASTGQRWEDRWSPGKRSSRGTRRRPQPGRGAGM